MFVAVVLPLTGQGERVNAGDAVVTICHVVVAMFTSLFVRAGLENAEVMVLGLRDIKRSEMKLVTRLFKLMFSLNQIIKE